MTPSSTKPYATCFRNFSLRRMKLGTHGIHAQVSRNYGSVECVDGHDRLTG